MLNSLRTTNGKRIGMFWKNQSTGFHDGKGWRKNANPFAIKGVPDILGCSQRGTIMMEVKTPSGKVSEDQRAFAKAIQLYEQRVYVVRECRDALKALAREGFDELELPLVVSTDLLLTCEDLAFLRDSQNQSREFLKIDLRIL